MDLSCEKCHTEYEFDDARIPDEGVPVQCTACGHIFRVYRRTYLAEPASPASQAPRDWKIRRQNGDLFTCKELTTLQKWIVEGKVGRDDQISKSGDTWKRLGDIPELGPFFDVYDAALKARGVPAPAPRQPAPAPGHLYAPPAGSPLSTQPGLYSARPPAPAPAPQVATALRPPRAVKGDPEWAARAPVTPPPGAGPSLSPLDDPELEAAAAQIRGSGKWKWAVGVLALVLLGLGGFYFAAPRRFLQTFGLAPPELPPLARSHHDSGRLHYLKGSHAELLRAVEDYNLALKHAGEVPFPEAHVALADAYVALGDEAAERAVALREEASAPPPPDAVSDLARAENLAKQARELEAQAARHYEAAFAAGKRAIELAPESPAAARALANYYRAVGRKAQMEPLVAQARAAVQRDADLSTMMGLAQLGDETQRESARKHLSEALEIQPEMNAARYALARTLAADKEPQKALVQLKGVLSRAPDHERARLLFEKIEASLAPPPPPAPAPEPPKSKPLTYDQLLQKAARLREMDPPRSEQALKLYGQAADMKPESAEPIVGKGWCYLDMDAHAPAIASFQQALELNPGYAPAMMGLAEAYRARGDKASALDWYKRYLERHPAGEDAEAARNAIDALK